MPDNNNLDRVLNEILQRKSNTRLETLLGGYHLSSVSEGKSPNTIAIVEASVRYLEEFLASNGLPTDVAAIGVDELRRFTVYLKERPRFARHRFTRPQGGHLSGHTINGYLRALQSFWSWLEREDFVNDNPFSKMKIPKAPKKIIPIFSEEQLRLVETWLNLQSQSKVSSSALMELRLPTSEAGCHLVLDALGRTEAEIGRLGTYLKDGEKEIDMMVAKLYGLSRQHRRVIKEFLTRF